MHSAFIALGSNIKPKEKYLKRAIDRLDEHSAVSVVDRSSIYETEPVGYLDQDQFLNMVIKVETTATPEELLSICQDIEQNLGRERTVKNGPRTIDLDILLFDDKKIQFEHLMIPHPRMKERAFVLVPLEEIGADITFDGKRVSDHVQTLPVEDLKGVWKKRER